MGRLLFTGFASVSAADLLAVVPVLRAPTWLRVLILFLPLILGAALFALLLPVVWWVCRSRFWRFRWLLTGLVCAAGLSVLGHGFARMARRPSAAQFGPPVSSTGTWPTFMGNMARTGRVEGAKAPAAGEGIWDFSDGLRQAPFAGSPAAVGGRVYVGSDSKRLYCLDAAGGGVVWVFKAAHEIFASPVVADGRVLVGEGLHHSKDCKLYCLDAATGGPVWAFQTASHIEFGPTLFDGRVFFAAGDDGVYCVDARTGEEQWRFDAVTVNMSPAVTGSGVFFGNVVGRPHFYRLDPANGKVIWKKPAAYGVCGSPSTDGERVYFGLGNGTFGMSHAQPNGAVSCLSVADGSIVWTREARDAVLTTVGLADGAALYGSRDGHLYCVDAATGEFRWSFVTEGPVLSSPALAGGRVYFGSDDGCLYCLDAASGKQVWKYDTSRAAFHPDARVISSPAIAGGRVYVGSMNSHFFCLGEREPAGR